MSASELLLKAAGNVAWFCGWVLSFTAGGVVGVVILNTFNSADPTAQIVGAIVFSGCLIAAAIWFKKQAVLNVYGNDWRVSESPEGNPNDR